MTSIKTQAADHIKQAKRNEEFYQSVKNEYPDWGIIALFYSALHYVDAFLKYKNIDAEDHRERRSRILKTSELKPMYSRYNVLYKYSIDARYNMVIPNITNVEDVYIMFFLPLKNFIEDLLQQ